MEGESATGPLLGYCIVAAGALDLIAAIVMLLIEKPADPAARRNLVMVLGMSGVGMIALGAMFWLGVLGGA